MADAAVDEVRPSSRATGLTRPRVEAETSFGVAGRPREVPEGIRRGSDGYPMGIARDFAPNKKHVWAAGGVGSAFKHGFDRAGWLVIQTASPLLHAYSRNGF